MTINIQSSHSFPINAYQGLTTTATPAMTSSPVADLNGSEAYVYNVGATAVEKSREPSPDEPLSNAENELLFKVYSELGKDHPLWEDIGTLLSEKLLGNDRSNFLATLSEAGDLMETFVEQVSFLKEEDRSLYLGTAMRNGSGEALSNLIDAANSLSEEQFTNFLTTADNFGRSAESKKAGELENFIAAVAQSPGALDDLVEKMSILNEQDRALFLETAANAEDKIERFIDTSGLLTGSDLTLFLENARTADKGLSNLLTLTGELKGETRSGFLRFTAGLEDGNAENFLIATRGNKKNEAGLVNTTLSLKGSDRIDFLTLAADAGSSLRGLISMTNDLEDNPARRSDFLTTAIKAEEGFDHFLDITGELGGKGLTNVLSFASTLGFTDLTNFISAAKANPSKATELADTAEDLKGKDKSYLLYAAALNPENTAEFTTMTRSLKGQVQSDFLFTAANITPYDPDDTGNPDPMDEFLKTADRLTAVEKKAFFAQERMSAVGDPQTPAKAYVHMKSVFDDAALEAVLSAGGNVDRMISNFDSMGSDQRETFFSVAQVTDKEMLQELMSVMTRLDENGSNKFLAFANTLDKERSNEFITLASTLDKENISNLVTAADNALGESGEDIEAYDRLMETVQGLDLDVRRDFLNAAAHAGGNLDRLMDLTDKFTGALQAVFIETASVVADRGEGGLGIFLKTTEHIIISKGVMGIPDSTGISNGLRPSDLIQDGEFKGRWEMSSKLLPSTVKELVKFFKLNTSSDTVPV